MVTIKYLDFKDWREKTFLDFHEAAAFFRFLPHIEVIDVDYSERFTTLTDTSDGGTAPYTVTLRVKSTGVPVYVGDYDRRVPIHAVLYRDYLERKDEVVGCALCSTVPSVKRGYEEPLKRLAFLIDSLAASKDLFSWVIAWKSGKIQEQIDQQWIDYIETRTGQPSEQAVIVRVWKDTGETIVFFPEYPADKARGLMWSYMHIGEHGAAAYFDLLSDTRPATDEEAEEILKELSRRPEYRHVTFKRYRRFTKSLQKVFHENPES